MRILWTNHALDQPAGTENFTRDLTRELTRRGHQVEILCTRAGMIAEELRAEDTSIHTDPRALAGRYDLIHGQHFVETAVALAALPGTPALFFCHGDTTGDWIEHPPHHPRLVRWLTTCDNLRDHLARLFQRDASTIDVLPNALAPNAMPGIAPPAWPPQTAVVFHNTLTTDSPEWEYAAALCRDKGISLTGIGAGFGRRSLHPREDLAMADLVFARGRCALEAIALGRAVVVLGTGHSGGLARAEDYPALLASNFTRTGRESAWSDPPESWEATGQSAENIARLGALVREHHALPRVADQLELIHREVAAARLEIRPAEESMADAVNLQVAWRQMAAAHETVRSTTRKAARLEEKLAHTQGLRRQSKERAEAIESQFRRTWWGRRIWRFILKSIPQSSNNPP